MSDPVGNGSDKRHKQDKALQINSSLNSSLSYILVKIEEELKLLCLWSASAPSAEQLASSEPFCLDTLSFPEWLQFVLLPRMDHILQKGLDLPSNSQIAPMADEYFTQSGKADELKVLISELDNLLQR